MELVLIGAVLVFIVISFVMSNRRKKREAVVTETKMVVGADVMTGSGIYGTIVELVRDENEVVQKIIISTSTEHPEQTLTLHRQAIARYIDPEVPVDEAETSDDAVAEEATPSSGVLLNGQPVEGADEKPKRTPRKKTDTSEA